MNTEGEKELMLLTLRENLVSYGALPCSDSKELFMALGEILIQPFMVLVVVCTVQALLKS